MATVPTPFDAVAVSKLTAVALDAGIKEPLDWLLTGYPRVHAWDSTSLSIPNATATLVTFNSEGYDTDNMHSTASNTSRILCNTDGLYEFDYLTTISNATYTQLDLQIRLNAAGSSAGGSVVRTQPFSDGTRGTTGMAFRMFRFMSAGDYLEAFITQASGGARTLAPTSLGTRCFARWVATS